MMSQPLPFLTHEVHEALSISRLSAKTWDLDESLSWLERCRQRASALIELRELDQLSNWTLDQTGTKISHDSGSFFTIQTKQVHNVVSGERWQQPTISQPEVGLLGLPLRFQDGKLEGLVQAKFEPGNPKLIQISPGIQATTSNLNQAHGGAVVPLASLFRKAPRSSILAESSQLEDSELFLQKRNLNIAAFCANLRPPNDQFKWLPVGAILALLQIDNSIHMDLRSVLSCLPWESLTTQNQSPLNLFLQKSNFLPTQTTLSDEPHPSSLTRLSELKNPFQVIGISIERSNREVAQWMQPLIACASASKFVLLMAIDSSGNRCYLTQMRKEFGSSNAIELGPTLSEVDHGIETSDVCEPLNKLINGRDNRVVFDVNWSKEGGRYFNCTNRYQIIQIPYQPAPSGFLWLDSEQLQSLLTEGNIANEPLRSLILASKVIE